MIKRPPFNLQWHITGVCDLRCKHCYMFDGPRYQDEVRNELSVEDCKRVIDDFVETKRKWNAVGSIAFTGGHPLIRKGFWDIIGHARKRNLGDFVIMGNPSFLTREVAMDLKRHGVVSYQISLDGLEETHDKVRKKGSFQATLNAYRILGEVGIERGIMMTLTPENKHDFLGVIRLAHEEKLDFFSFTRVSAEGNAEKNYKTEVLDPWEYRELYRQAVLLYMDLEAKGSRTYFDTKDHLWVPLFFEEGWIQHESELSARHARRCGMGLGALTLLSDGTVLSCRRVNTAIGKVPEQKMADIWLQSKFLAEVRDNSSFKWCKECKYNTWCLGCPAIAAALHGDLFGDDPQCWRIASKKAGQDPDVYWREKSEPYRSGEKVAPGVKPRLPEPSECTG